jgi:hypothetical protein
VSVIASLQSEAIQRKDGLVSITSLGSLPHTHNYAIENDRDFHLDKICMRIGKGCFAGKAERNWRVDLNDTPGKGQAAKHQAWVTYCW